MLFSSAISLWLWGRVVQLRLDEIMHENRIHKIRKQKKTLLPSGGRRIDIYNNPEKFGAHLKDRLIHIPDEIIDNLLQKYDRPDLLQFGTDDNVHLMEQIYRKIGSPKLSARVGWSVFVEMVNVYIELQTGSDELWAIETFDGYHVLIIIKLYISVLPAIHCPNPTNECFFTCRWILYVGISRIPVGPWAPINISKAERGTMRFSSTLRLWICERIFLGMSVEMSIAWINWLSGHNGTNNAHQERKRNLDEDKVDFRRFCTHHVQVPTCQIHEHWIRWTSQSKPLGACSFSHFSKIWLQQFVQN